MGPQGLRRAALNAAVLFMATTVASAALYPQSADAKTLKVETLKPVSGPLLLEYKATKSLWETLLAANPSLASAEEFTRLLVAEVKHSGRIPNFGNEFEAVIARRQPYACISFKLCEEKVVPAFRAASTPGVTDIVEYLMEATCFGFLPVYANRLQALRLLERVVTSVGYADLPFTLADRRYLRTTFADMLATAADEWSGKRGQFPNLRSMAQHADPRANFKRLKGSRRPLQDEVKAAAMDACKNI
jgi:hypothetical protein